jgi:hypothetical protein
VKHGILLMGRVIKINENKINENKINENESWRSGQLRFCMHCKKKDNDLYTLSFDYRQKHKTEQRLVKTYP